MKLLGTSLAAVFAAAALAYTPQAQAFPGHCQIELINASHHDVWVRGTFDDGSPLHTFKMYSYEAPHYIDLYYSGHCHSGMHLLVESIQLPHNVMLYNAWTHVNSTVHVVPL